MYITLKSTKRDLGLFGLEIPDLIIGAIFGIFFVIFFTSGLYEIGILIIALGCFLLVPINFSKKNRMYKLLFIIFRYFFSPKNYYYNKTNENIEIKNNIKIKNGFMVKIDDKIKTIKGKI